MAQIQRKHNFQPGTFISSSQVNAELNNIVDNHNVNDEKLKTLDENAFLKTKIRTGRTASIFAAAGRDSSYNLSYASPFSKTPTVSLTPFTAGRDLNGVTYQITASNAAGCTVYVKNSHASADVSLAFDYIAIEI